MSTEIKGNSEPIKQSRKDTVQYINLQTSFARTTHLSDDQNAEEQFCNPKFQDLTNGLIKSFREKSQLLSRSSFSGRHQNSKFPERLSQRCSVQRILCFAQRHIGADPKRAREELSLPPNGTTFKGRRCYFLQGQTRDFEQSLPMTKEPQ